MVGIICDGSAILKYLESNTPQGISWISGSERTETYG